MERIGILTRWDVLTFLGASKEILIPSKIVR
jgi:hypothetical protein